MGCLWKYQCFSCWGLWGQTQEAQIIIDLGFQFYMRFKSGILLTRDTNPIGFQLWDLCVEGLVTQHIIEYDNAFKIGDAE